MPVNVLLVDDSAVIRGLMAKALSADAQINVCGTAANGEMAINMCRQLQPDIIILDIEMPVMDGITALPGILAAAPKTKIIMASTLTLRNAEISLKALELGATDYMSKPSTKVGGDADNFYKEMIQKIKILGGGAASVPAPAPAPKPVIAAPVPKMAAAPVSQAPLYQTGVSALAIASSTGGPQALMQFFEHIKGHLGTIPIFITQHMPPTFTTILADHLGKSGARPCSEGKDGQMVEGGKAYLAPGDYHMVVEENPGHEVVIRINQDPPENFCRPAADPMLRSLSKVYGKHLAVLVLTGMGQDGLEGAKVAVSNGGSVIAQDEASCVVYGMPRAVAEHNLCRAVLPLGEIGHYLVSQIERRA